MELSKPESASRARVSRARRVCALACLFASFACSGELLPTHGADDAAPPDARAPDPDATPPIPSACNGCHGSASNDAPPVDTTGGTTTDLRGVGAHQSHLAILPVWRREVACEDCHLVPAVRDEIGHNDTELPAEIVFSAAAIPDGATPAWNSATCTDTYCHGFTLTGGAATAPTWTMVDATQSQCNSCHGQPPPPPHSTVANCGVCHPNMQPGTLTFLAPATHMDGNVDLSDGVPCDTCHGSDDNPAPPLDTSGNTSTAERGVGAHRAHGGPSDRNKEVVCSECHAVPIVVDTPGHTDTELPAEVVFGPLSGAATWDGTRCSDSYCHGATLTGGDATAPVWTTVDGSQVQCDSCHGNPPPAPHIQLATCEGCHGEVVGAGGVIVASELHIDGTVQIGANHPGDWVEPTPKHGDAFNTGDLELCRACHGDALDGGAAGVSCESCHADWQTDCTYCHGATDNMTGAPPAAVDGATIRTDLAVGAHTLHVDATAMHVAWDCERCHVVPTAALDVGHIDGDARAEVVFDALNPGASYDLTGSCANLYCHGDGQTPLASMDWGIDPVMDCTSCHDDGTAGGVGMSGDHELHFTQAVPCQECHNTVVDAAVTIIGLDLHVNGTADVDFLQGGTLAGGTCSGLGAACHADETW